MSRRASRITQDEVARMIRAVQSCGLSIGGVTFNGDRVDVVIDNGDSGDQRPALAGQEDDGPGPIMEPQL